MTMQFKAGDKVKVNYFYDTNPYNGQIGTIKWLHKYSYYPDGDIARAVEKTQGVIEYKDGHEEAVSDFYRKGSVRVV